MEAESKLALAPVFSDHMVLQREKTICIFGRGTPSRRVSVALGEAAAQTVVRPDGCWAAALPAQAAAAGLTMTVQDRQDACVVRDVAIGEVWLAGGQSNMEFPLYFDADFPAEQADASDADLRFFDQPELCYAGQENDFDYSQMGVWRRCDEKNLAWFSAVGYYFAVRLRRALGVPVGILGCNRGGSVSAAWMCRASYERCGGSWKTEYAGLTEEKLAELRARYRGQPNANTGRPFDDPVSVQLMLGMPYTEQKKLLELLPPELMAPAGPDFANRPACLYENMLLPLAPYTLRGVLWYQGESDARHPEVFKAMTGALIEDWRALWGEELPFCCVQLAPFARWMGCDGAAFPALRQMQAALSQEKKNVFLVSASDAGMRDDIHPKRKAPLGRRLALCALRHVYGFSVEADAPFGSKAWWQDGQLYIRFAQTAGGLLLRGSRVHALRVTAQLPAGERCYDEPEGSAAGADLLAVRLPREAVGMPCTVSYAQTDYYEVNLYNLAGMPALPFCCSVKEGAHTV